MRLAPGASTRAERERARWYGPAASAAGTFASGPGYRGRECSRSARALLPEADRGRIGRVPRPRSSGNRALSQPVRQAPDRLGRRGGALHAPDELPRSGVRLRRSGRDRRGDREWPRRDRAGRGASAMQGRLVHGLRSAGTEPARGPGCRGPGRHRPRHHRTQADGGGTSRIPAGARVDAQRDPRPGLLEGREPRLPGMQPCFRAGCRVLRACGDHRQGRLPDGVARAGGQVSRRRPQGHREWQRHANDRGDSDHAHGRHDHAADQQGAPARFERQGLWRAGNLPRHHRAQAELGGERTADPGDRTDQRVDRDDRPRWGHRVREPRLRARLGLDAPGGARTEPADSQEWPAGRGLLSRDVGDPVAWRGLDGLPGQSPQGRQPLRGIGDHLADSRYRRTDRQLRGGEARHHRRASSRAAAAAGAEDGDGGTPGRRRRPRLQQPPRRHLRLW